MLSGLFILAEFDKLELYFFLTPREFFHHASCGGGHAWDMVGLQPFEQGHGEGHLAHEVHGDIARGGQGQHLTEVVVSQRGNVLLVALRVDVGEWEVANGAIELVGRRRLPGIPLGRRMVGEVDEHGGLSLGFDEIDQFSSFRRIDKKTSTVVSDSHKRGYLRPFWVILS